MQVLERLIAPLFDPLDQRSLVSYLCAVTFLLIFTVCIRVLRRRPMFRLRSFRRLVFRKSVFLHRSALLDYKMFAVNLPFMVFGVGFFILNSAFWSRVAGAWLQSEFGPAAQTTTTSIWVVVGVALVLLLAMDFGYWLGHAAMHKSKILWEFHKVHHSAEVLTFATEFRQHPVELVVIPCTIGLTTGVSFALIQQWLGTGVSDLGHMGYNLIVMAHLATFHHIRHSHINMPFTGVWGRLLHSPGHHLVHHSVDPKHHDCNMGYILSIWDGLAGTLVLPEANQKLVLGIGAEGLEHDGLVRSFTSPFWKAYRLSLKSFSRVKPAAGRG